MNRKNAAIIEMCVCATLWSLAGILMKLVPWNGFAVAGMRSLVAGLTMLCYMRIKRIRFVISGKTLTAAALTACLYICFACANKLTTAANAIVLQFTSPVFIVLITAIIYRKRIPHSDAAVTLFTLAGIALCFLDKLESGYTLGNIISVAAGLTMAGMYMLVGEQKDDERFSSITTGQFITFLAGLPFVIATRPEFSRTAVISILVLGVFQLGIAYILYVRSAAHCPPLACCLLGAIEPLLNPVWVMIFDGETPGPLALAGGLIVIVSITVWCVYNHKQESAHESAA